MLKITQSRMTAIQIPPPPRSMVQAALDDTSLISLDDLNELIDRCRMPVTPITTLSRCSSSFFVCLFDYVFGFSLKNIEQDITTTEMKRRNLHLVVTAVSNMLNTPLLSSHVSPDRILQGDEVHISRLLHVFMMVESYLRRCRAEMGFAEESTTEDAMSSVAEVSQQDGEDLVEPHRVPPAAPRTDSAPPRLPTAASLHVSSWQSGVVPPSGEAGSHAINASHNDSSLDDVRDRVNFAAKVAGVPPEAPSTPAATSFDRTFRFFKAVPGVRTLSAAFRDTKIEHLRVQRFVDAADREMLKAAVRNANAIEVKTRQEVKKQLRTHIKESIEAKQAIKEQDDMLRHVYMDVMLSAAAREGNKSVPTAPPVTQRKGKSDRALSCLKKQLQQFAAAREDSTALARSQQESLKQDYARYVQSVSVWRKHAALFSGHATAA